MSELPRNRLQPFGVESRLMPLPRVTRKERPGVPALERQSGSWIATNPDGQVVEFFNRANAEKAHAAGWRVETALQYLGRIHREAKATRTSAALDDDLPF